MAKKKETKVGTDGRPTKEQIDAWKEEYGELSKIKIPGDKELIAIVRKPKLRDLKMASMVSKTKSDVDVIENLYNNCVLYEDALIRKHDENYMAAITKMGEVVQIKDAELEKL